MPGFRSGAFFFKETLSADSASPAAGKADGVPGGAKSELRGRAARNEPLCQLCWYTFARVPEWAIGMRISALIRVSAFGRSPEVS